MTTATSLYDMAVDLLGHAVAALATTPSGAPARQFVSVGDPAYDCCPLVSVHVRAGDRAPYGPAQSAGDSLHRSRTTTVNLFSFTVTTLRCVPVMQGGAGGIMSPTPADLSASASEVYQDGWVLWNTLSRDLRAGTLWTGYPVRELELGPIVPANTSGGCGGWLLLLTAALDGYVP